MKTSTTQAGKIWPAIGKVVAALAVAAMIGGIAMTPAYGQGKGHDKGWHKGQSRDYYYPRDYYPREYRPVYREHYYSPPVYVPAPVYHYPYQSPGISLFFPLDLR